MIEIKSGKAGVRPVRQWQAGRVPLNAAEGFIRISSLETELHAARQRAKFAVHKRARASVSEERLAGHRETMQPARQGNSASSFGGRWSPEDALRQKLGMPARDAVARKNKAKAK